MHITKQHIHTTQAACTVSSVYAVNMAVDLSHVQLCAPSMVTPTIGPSDADEKDTTTPVCH